MNLLFNMHQYMKGSSSPFATIFPLVPPLATQINKGLLLSFLLAEIKYKRFQIEALRSYQFLIYSPNTMVSVLREWRLAYASALLQSKIIFCHLCYVKGLWYELMQRPK